MGVADGQRGNQTTLNNAFMARNNDTSTTGAVNLASAASADGTAVTSSQKEHNSIASFVGKSLNTAKDALPSWASDIVGSASQTIKARIESIVQKFRDTAANGGHTHAGTDGDGPKIPVASINATGTPGASNYLRGDGAWSATSGGGQGGINFLTYDSAYDDSVTDSSDFDAAVGNWVAYADAAAASPVDMTGGSPTTTFTRSTSSPLNGTAHGLLTKDAANRQGEGVACVAYIPPAYRTSRIYYEFAYKVTSGTYALDDTQVFVYDVTNSKVITPFRQSKIYGTQGVAFGYFDIQSTTAQIRFGLHVASTSASAYTLAIDDVKVGPSAISFSAPVGDLVSKSDYAFVGIGTPTSVDVWEKRIGDTVFVTGSLIAGTPTASNLAVTLPSRIPIDTSKFTTNYRKVGDGINNVAASDFVTSDGVGLHAIASSASSNTVYLTDSSASQAYALRPANGIISSGNKISFQFSVPISGWSSNVQMADSASFKISNFLANGTRVTGSAPTSLGQYRSYLRNASAATYTETNGNPTTVPTAADGIKIYNGGSWAAADANNEPTRYEIFVGKNKNVKAEWYASAGRTGVVNASPISPGGTIDYGYNVSYDPTTGIVTVVNTLVSAGNRTAHNSGTDASGFTAVNDIYFDIVVSENAVSVGAESCRSEVWVTGDNNRGSTNTAIRRFVTTQKSTGTAITYADSATAGGSFTINEDGIYAISYTTESNASAMTWGVSLNSSQLTTSVHDINAADRLAIMETRTIASQGNMNASMAVTLNLRAGDVVRAHSNLSDGAVDTDFNSFRICKVNL